MGDATKAGPGRMVRVVLCLFLAGLCSRGYGDYNQALKAGGAEWNDVAAGTAHAPEQYRIGVVVSALWFAQHTGLRLSRVFAIFDLGMGVLAVLLLYRVLERGSVYREATVAMQFFGSAAFVALAIYALDWTHWYARVTTLPATGLAAAMVWFWMARGRMWVNAAMFVLLCAALAFVRADVVVMLCAGLFAVSLSRRVPDAGLPRAAALGVSAAGMTVAAGVQIYLMKVRYPQADYGGVPVLMLSHDWWRVTEWAALLIFVAPVLWTAAEAWRSRAREISAAVGFLVGGLAYLLLWVLVGRLDEVRIFLPVSLALLPLTVETAMRRVAGTDPDAPEFHTIATDMA